MDEEFILHREKRPKNSDAPLHYHSSYEVFILLKGHTRILVDDKLINVNERDIVLLKPDIVHKNIGEKWHDRYSLHFTKAYLKSHFSSETAERLIICFNNNKLVPDDRTFKNILDLLKRIETEPEYVCIHTAEIITLLQNKNNLQTVDTSTKPRISNNILEYIKQNYANISGLDDIADNVHISKEYLCQVFKKETGVTVSEYMNTIRINNACELLQSGKYNITETAAMCGYNSTPYFCRVFKEIIHMTPKEYQKTF